MDKVEVVIPTWNSMPELKESIESIPYAFKGLKVEIYIVDNSSTDGTREWAEENGCHVLTDTRSLGSARLTGAKQVEGDSFFFIDSDIILPYSWYKSFDKYYKKLIKKHDNVGMVFGTTLNINPKMKKMQEWKTPINPRLLKSGERAWTNNTWIKTDLVLSADIEDNSGWEDWMIAQNVMNHGYRVYHIPLSCIHNHSTVSKWGFVRSGWCAKGMMDVMGLNLYSFKYLNYYPYQGLTATIKFKDLYYLKWGLITWKEVMQGVLNLKTFSRK